MPDTQRLTTALGGRYAIERELGAGGMATVYLARDVKHDRDVALKVLRPELFAVLGSERFLAEIKITARLDHPHILTLIDSGAVDGFLYYVLPYVRGESLRARLEREKQLGIDEALSITRQIASALDYAHQRGVVHRDIKPENILLHEGEAVLADFGIALAVKEAGGNRLTETGLSLGTPQYMSPEQATGDRALDARSDVYSLAAVLYEMLAGEPPVSGPTVQAVIAKLMTERPTRIRTVRDTVPEGIDNAVAKALAKVPADRFASAGQFVQELQAGGRPSRSGGAPPPTPRRTVVVAAAILAGAAVLGAVAYALLSRGETVRVVQPDRQQITFTGNARTPGLSPDGQRLAFSTRTCTGDGYCTVDVVVQDVGGVGASTVLRGWAAIWAIDWTRDGRFLLVNGFQGTTGNWGPFVVPSLGGGQPRFLGCCWANLGAGDTALVSRSTGGDSLQQLLFVTLGDGVTRDSLVLPRPAGSFSVAAALPGNRLLLARRASDGYTALVLDRNGTIRDSLLVTQPGHEVVGAMFGSSVVMVRTPDENSLDRSIITAHRIDAEGRIAARPETVLTQVEGALYDARNGMMLNSAGPTDYEIWLLRRANPGSMRFTQRRLAASTARLGGLMSPSGDRVMFWRQVTQGGRRLVQAAVMSSDSGPETPVGAPLDVADWEWNSEGTGLIIGIFRGDSVDLGDLDVPGGRFRPRRAVSRLDFAALWALPGNGIMAVDAAHRKIRIIDAGWRSDTTFAYPETEGTFEDLVASRDGREVIAMGWDRQSDSVVVRRVSLADGRFTRIGTFYGDGWQGPVWLPDGTIIVPIRETGSTLVWFRLPATGGRAVRLGTPPRATDASLRMTADGRTAIARVTAQRPDVYLIRNFRDLLPR